MAEEAGDGLLLVLANSLTSVEEGRRALIDYLKPECVDARALNRLEVVFEELVSNIVRHGFKAGSDQAIQVRASADQMGVYLTVEDDGAPFDPLTAPRPKAFGTLEEATVGGLGIELVRRLASHVAYEVVPADMDAAPGGFIPRNRVRLTILRR